MGKYIKNGVVLLPPPEVGAARLREAFDAIDKEIEEYYSMKSEEFQKNFRLVKRCAFLTGFFSAFSFNGNIMRSHYKWCPLFDGGSALPKPLRFVVDEFSFVEKPQ